MVEPVAVNAVRLILIRHGEAERVAPRDELRRLTLRGRDEATAVAGVIRDLGLQPSGVCASPYVRAQETAAIIASVLSVAGLRGDPVATLRGVTPDDDPRRALVQIDKLLQSHTLPIVVTHMPLIGALVGLLVDGDLRAAPGIGTGCGVVLAGDVLAPGLLRVEHVLTP